jgi:ABC-2 type transport system permease protein
MIGELGATGIVLMHTLKRMRSVLMWWTIGVAVYTIINIAVYPSFKDSMLLEAQNYPEALIRAFGLDNLDQIGPYMYAQVFLMLPLILAFFPIMTFAGALAGAEERGGLDVLLTQPIRRRSLVLATWIAAVVCVGIVLAATGLLSWLLIVLIGESLGFGETMLAAWSVWPVTVAVGSIGLLLSAALRSRGTVLGASIGIAFLLYLIDVVGKIATELDNIRWVSPFRYFNDVFTHEVPVWHYFLLIGVSLMLLGIAIRVFDRRDIYT